MILFDKFSGFSYIFFFFLLFLFIFLWQKFRWEGGRAWVKRRYDNDDSFFFNVFLPLLLSVFLSFCANFYCSGWPAAFWKGATNR